MPGQALVGDQWAGEPELGVGFSGAKLVRPALDALRDQAARAAFDLVLITSPDRLARNYVHQMVVLEELERRGVPVVSVDRPSRDDPHEQLVLQIRGAVAEYERTLIADRMRRGRASRSWPNSCRWRSARPCRPRPCPPPVEGRVPGLVSFLAGGLTP